MKRLPIFVAGLVSGCLLTVAAVWAMDGLSYSDCILHHIKSGTGSDAAQYVMGACRRKHFIFQD